MRRWRSRCRRRLRHFPLRFLMLLRCSLLRRICLRLRLWLWHHRGSFRGVGSVVVVAGSFVIIASPPPPRVVLLHLGAASLLSFLSNPSSTAAAGRFHPTLLKFYNEHKFVSFRSIYSFFAVVPQPQTERNKSSFGLETENKTKRARYRNSACCLANKLAAEFTLFARFCLGE